VARRSGDSGPRLAARRRGSATRVAATATNDGGSAMRSRGTTLFLLCALAALPLGAQTTGRIDGRTVDAGDESPLPGVLVTITSPDLQGAREATSDANGQFRFLGLPPGVYAVKATLDSYSPIEQSDVRVSLDRAVSLVLSLQGGIVDVITVTAETPLIDTSTTTAGANFTEEIFNQLPVPRTFQGLAFKAPGVVSGGLGDNPSIGGASAAENRYVVEGLDTTDAAFGTIATEVPFEFIKEVEVKTGGYEAEYGGALGGLLNVITKSGGNQLSGNLFGYFSDDSLQAEAEPIIQFGQDLGYTEYDFGAALGGKLIEDKLWYFAAVNPSRLEETYTTRTGVENTEQVETLFFAGKLTAQPHPSHQFVLSAFGDPTDIEGNLTARSAAGLVGDDREQGANNYSANYSATLSADAFLELAAGRTDQKFRQQPFTDVPFYELLRVGAVPFALADGCPGDNQALLGLGPDRRFATSTWNPGCVGGTFVQENGDSKRDDARGVFNWFANTGKVAHEIKMGANYRQVEYEDFGHYPGARPGPFFDSRGGSVDGDGNFLPGVPVEANGLAGQRWQLFTPSPGGGLARLIEYDQASVGDTEEQSLFLQDRLRLGERFSLNLGVRADAFTSKGDLSDSVAGRELDFDFGDMIAPRVGFTWDVAGNGKSKLYGHFGRFYESVPLDINARAFGNEKFNFYYFHYPEDGSLPTASNPGTHYYTYRLGGGTLVDPDIKPMYTEEALAGFDYQVLPNLSIGVKYTERTIEDVIEDISVDGGQHYFITNPGDTISVEPVTGRPLAAPIDFPEALREYTAYELTLNKRFSNSWQLYASYVNAENEGNYGGLFRQDNAQLDPNITSLFDLPDLLDGATGRLPNDREHQVKAYGSYLWPFKLLTGFSGQFLSGTPITQFGAHPVYGRRERFVTPRGSFGTTPDVWNIDLRLEYPLTLGGFDLRLVADVFNVSDEQEVTVVDQEWTQAQSRLANVINPPAGTTTQFQLTCGGPGTGPGTNCPNGNPLFGEPTARQAPRTIRLGVKFEF
jgi:outer membrane receptor protein involved in Fe transport